MKLILTCFVVLASAVFADELFIKLVFSDGEEIRAEGFVSEPKSDFVMFRYIHKDKVHFISVKNAQFNDEIVNRMKTRSSEGRAYFPRSTGGYSPVSGWEHRLVLPVASGAENQVVDAFKVGKTDAMANDFERVSVDGGSAMHGEPVLDEKNRFKFTKLLKPAKYVKYLPVEKLPENPLMQRNLIDLGPGLRDILNKNGAIPEDKSQVIPIVLLPNLQGHPQTFQYEGNEYVTGVHRDALEAHLKDSSVPLQKLQIPEDIVRRAHPTDLSDWNLALRNEQAFFKAPPFARNHLMRTFTGVRSSKGDEQWAQAVAEQNRLWKEYLFQRQKNREGGWIAFLKNCFKKTE